MNVMPKALGACFMVFGGFALISGLVLLAAA